MTGQSNILSEREVQVLSLVAAGLSNAAIGKRLGLSRHTVAWYNQRIYDKLHVKRRTEAVAVARSRGILDESMSVHVVPAHDGHRGAPRHNLPVQPQSFIGREDEVAAIANLLEDSSCRLLTLVGPGGIGKTRLALEVARHKLPIFRHGVFFVPLQPVTDPENIMPTIASSVGWYFQSNGRDPFQQLLDYLRHQTMLLLIDNCEHLLEGVPLVGELLQAAPKLKILATSRTTLNLREEQLYPVTGLPFPQDDRPANTHTFSAVALFADRARRLDPDFTLDHVMSDVHRICRLVEGMPLALELAATWVKSLSCEEIADEIQKGLDILETPMRNVPQRHQSMRAVFDYSWYLLVESERTVFRRLSVFGGGFTREAAQRVAGADLHALQALIDRSLIRRDAENERFDIHELLREYSAEQLAQQPDEQRSVRDRHADYFAEYLFSREQSMKNDVNYLWAPQLHMEFENVDLAWRWALQQGTIITLNKFPRILGYYLQTRGLFGYADAVYTQMAGYLREQPPGAPRDEALGRVVSHQGWMLHLSGRNQQALHLLEECLPLLDRPHSQYDLALSLSFLGRVKRMLGHYEPATEMLHRALAIFHNLDNAHGLWISLSFLGEIAYERHDYEQACGYLEAAIQVTDDAIGSIAGKQFSLPVLCMTYVALGKLQQARDGLLAALAANEKIEDVFPFFLTLAGIAVYLRAQNEESALAQLLFIGVEHPLSNTGVKIQLRPLLAELTDSLPEKVIDAAQNQAMTILEATNLTQQFLPQTYLAQLRQLLEEPVESINGTANLRPLTPRETEVLRLIARGYTTSDIAAELDIVVGTVRNYIKRIYAKFDIRNRVQAAEQARELGLL